MRQNYFSVSIRAVEFRTRLASHRGLGLVSVFLAAAIFTIFCPLSWADRYFVKPHLIPGPSPLGAEGWQPGIVTGKNAVRNGQPLQPLHGGAFSGPPVPLSPDPLVRYRWRRTGPDRALQYYMLRPVRVETPTPKSFRGLQTSLGRHCNITVRGTGSIRFDFGVESAAWLEFESPDFHGRVDMGISEFDAPAREHCIAVPQHIGNTYRLKLNPLFYEGVRFGWIYIHSFAGKPWHITNVRLICQIKPVNYRGSFACSNRMLTRIWYTGAYTVKLNLERNYFGAILMYRGDRYSWVGDAHVAQAASMAAFGNFNFVKENLDRTAGHGNGIASYYLYWILSLVDYYRFTGNLAELKTYEPVANRLLMKAAAEFDNPPVRFYGWDDRLGGFRPTAAASRACRMLLIETCRRYAGALGAAGRLSLAKKFRRMADKFQASVEKHRWIRHADVFVASDAINGGVPTAAQMPRVERLYFSNRLDRISFSPFNEYFVVEAMARAHLWNQAIETVLDDWGGQIRYGGTTFFECYWPSWNRVIGHNGPLPTCDAGDTSLCHPWSAGCTAWLTRWVAGIRPATPGFATVDIIPHLGRMLTWVRATEPTPHGTVSEYINVGRGPKGIGRYTIPPGTAAWIGIPKVGRRIINVVVNGKTAWTRGHFKPVPGIGAVQQTTNYVYFKNVQPGSYRFGITYSGHTPPFLPEPFVYPAQVLGTDRITRGNWGGVYGHDGYMLLGSGPHSTNTSHLPHYVKSVVLTAGRTMQWHSNDHDPRALATGPSNRRRRPAGVFYGSPIINPTFAVGW